MRYPLPHRLAHHLARRVARHIARHLASCREEAGVAALEFALVLPLFLMGILGIIQYGYHYWSYETAAANAREAARRLIVGTDWTCTQAKAIQGASGPAVGGVTPVVSRRYHTQSGVTEPGPVVGDLVTVTVTFQSLDMQVPFLPVPNNGQVSQTGVGRIEVVPPQRLGCDDTQNPVVGGTY